MEKARVKHVFLFLDLPAHSLSSRNPEGTEYNASIVSFSLLKIYLCHVRHFVSKTALHDNMRLSSNKMFILFFRARKSKEWLPVFGDREIPFSSIFFLWFPDSENNLYKPNYRPTIVSGEWKLKYMKRNGIKYSKKVHFSWLGRKHAERIVK